MSRRYTFGPVLDTFGPVLVGLFALCSGCSSDPATSGTGGTGSASGGQGIGGAGGSGGTQLDGGQSGGSGGTGASVGTGGNDASSGGSGGSDATGGSGGASVAMKTYVYLGSGDFNGDSGKLHVYQFNDATAALTPIETVDIGGLNSFGAFHPSKQYLYSADEAEGKLYAYAIDADDGTLTFLNEVSTSSGPVYATVDATGKYLLTAYYDGGGVEVFAIKADGSLGDSVDAESTGDNAHSIVLSPDNKFAFVPNLGDDNVSQFAFDASTGSLTANSPPTVSGSDGPRHLAFHPNGKYVYLLNELDSMLTLYDYSEGDGTFAMRTSVSNLPDGISNKSSADVHATPDGKFLYATNRADQNSIAMHAIDADGSLSLLGHESTRGSSPRNFAIHPSGQWLLVANHGSNNLSSFSIQSDGKLEFIESPEPGAAVYWVGFLVLPE